MATSNTTQPVGGVHFATKQATVEKCKALIAKALNEDGSFKGNWSEILDSEEAEGGIKYSRGWLIIRRESLVRMQPNLLVSSSTLVAAFQESGKVAELEDPKYLVSAALSDTVKQLRDQKCSWGEIMVRLACTEGTARAAFEYKTTLRSLGQRVGKGGRWVAGRGDLYTDNRVKEGAYIPLSERPSEVKVEALANYIPKVATKVKVARKAAAPKTTKVAKAS